MERALGLIIIAVAGVLSLPVAAALLDREGTENFILPAQLIGMAGFGALVTWQIPGVVGATATMRRTLLVGAGIGLGFAFVGVGVFWFLLNGFSGA